MTDTQSLVPAPALDRGGDGRGCADRVEVRAAVEGGGAAEQGDSPYLTVNLR